MTSGRSILLALLTFASAAVVLMTPPRVRAAEEQAVIATIKLRSGNMGSSEERERISALEDQLSDAIKNSSVGERSEEHTSELQSRRDIVCRLLLEKKKQTSVRRIHQ